MRTIRWFGVFLGCTLLGLQLAQAQGGPLDVTTMLVSDDKALQSNVVMPFKLYANSQYDGYIALRFDPGLMRIVGSISGKGYATPRLWGYYNKRSLFFIRDDATKQIWYASWSWDQKQLSGFYVDVNGGVYPWSAEYYPSMIPKVTAPQNFEEPIVFNQSKVDFTCAVDGNGYTGNIDFILLSNRVSGMMSGHASYKGVTVQGVTNGRFMAFRRNDATNQIWTASIGANGRMFSGMFFDNNGSGFPWHGEKQAPK